MGVKYAQSRPVKYQIITNMSTNNNNPQTAVDGDGTTDLVPNEDPTATVDDDNAIGVCLRIKTVHLDCGGILDLEQNKVDEDVLCEYQNDELSFGSLADLTRDRLGEELHHAVESSGDHGDAVGPDYVFLNLEYVYDKKGQEAQSLMYVSDEELRSIVARGSGLVVAGWVWSD
ncbi:hypothetical protein UCDDA912_g04411 [Diaporthe ampelina]|uniref:Uncharacterized protein n=1 Tax=Diaporthe ampelina TaxID=1214573 RepID=A0A0G2I711_9PEZI|nr:hypothetical protein UCDDA912_g04411 [Diaporthe ampelina]